MTPEETTFHLLHLSLFREYLDFEFSALRNKVTTFEYDLERVLDDWVLMGFLVGNDFIPHLPNLHINHDALPLLWQTYIEVLPSCGGKRARLFYWLFVHKLYLLSTKQLAKIKCELDQVENNYYVKCNKTYIHIAIKMHDSMGNLQIHIIIQL